MRQGKIIRVIDTGRQSIVLRVIITLRDNLLGKDYGGQKWMRRNFFVS